MKITPQIELFFWCLDWLYIKALVKLVAILAVFMLFATRMVSVLWIRLPYLY